MIRFGRPSRDARNGVTQQTALPDRNSRLTPASRSVSTLRNWRMSQYSSWPTLRKVRHFSRVRA
jgi:hypothetical protein